MEIHFEINGKRVKLDDFSDMIQRSLLELVAQNIRERFGSIRHPETGEAPVIVVRGPNLDNLHMEITGSPELLEHVKDYLDENDCEREGEHAMNGTTDIKNVFLCHATEDKDFVRKLAHDLLSNGINVFFDEWEIQPGDSIVRKIDEGLVNCTHFIPVLSKVSINKEWVRTEIDAGLIRNISKLSSFIPIRLDLKVSELSPLLQSYLSPDFIDYDKSLSDLVSVIHGISKKPPLGNGSVHVTDRKLDRILSPAAESIVKLMVEMTEHGDSMDPQLSPDVIRKATKLNDDDIIDAIDELVGRGFIKKEVTLGCGRIGFHSIFPESELFSTFDKYYKEWDAEEDAIRIASQLVNNEGEFDSVKDIAKLYNWTPRRINPAVNYLANRQLVQVSEAVGTHPWTTSWIRKIPATRRFVRDRS